MSPIRVVLKIAIIVFIVHGLLMLGLSMAPPFPHHGVEALLGSVLLVLIGTPPIYLWVIKPYVEARREAEESLGEREALLRAVVDNSPTKIHIKDLEGRYTLINPEAAKLFGITDAEGRGKSSHDLFTKEKADAFMAHDRQVMESGKTTGREEYWQQDDGVRTFLTVKFPIRDASGDVSGVGAIGTDITERRKAEESLRAAHSELEQRVRERTQSLTEEIKRRERAERLIRDREEHLRAIMESVVDGIITIDDSGAIQTFNPAAEGIFGYSSDEVIGKNVNMLMPEPYHSKHDEYLARYLKTGEAKVIGAGREVEGKRKDGSVFPLYIAMNEMRVSGRRMFSGIVCDITERKTAEQELRSAKETAEVANRTKSEFLANMSHELRTPLNAIIGFSEVARNEIFGPMGNEKYIEYAVDVNESGKHLLAIINDILDLSAIEAEKIELDTEQVGLATLARVALQMVAEQAEHGRVSLVNKIGMDTPLIVGDKRRIKQILVNLLSNAVKFTLEDGEVMVSANLDANGCMEIVIADTGIGMDKEGVAKALEPFGQVTGDAAIAHEGTGLGLPLTKRLVEAHSGTLKLESTPNVGTTVTVRFPPERVIHAGQ